MRSPLVADVWRRARYAMAARAGCRLPSPAQFRSLDTIFIADNLAQRNATQGRATQWRLAQQAECGRATLALFD